MESNLQYLIRSVEEEPAEYTHVVIMLPEEGVRLRTQTKEACDVMAMVLNGNDKPGAAPTTKVIPREEFLTKMRKLAAETEPTYGIDPHSRDPLNLPTFSLSDSF